MKQNVGKADRIIRIVIGAVLFAAGIYLKGPAAVACFVIGAISLVTGLIGWCGFYTLFGINTCSVKK